MSAQSEFEKFLKDVGLDKPGTPAIQIQEMRRAFFAGQYSMFAFQITEVATKRDDEAEMLLAARQRELEDYFRSNFQKRN